MDVQNNTNRFDQAAASLSTNLKGILQMVPVSAKRSAFEIRLRAGSPIALICPGQCWFLGEGSELHNLPQKGYIITGADIADSVVSMCSHSVHSHQQEMCNGFISLRGGHRAGICGTAVLAGGKITAIREITSVNLRIAREVPGSAAPLIDKIFRHQLSGVLLVGPPSSGKTTLLRDLARQLSCGKAGRLYKVAVVDERCEIGAVYEGVAQNYLGPSCDILSGYPKGEGILTAIRTLSPQVIVCDEIGAREEVDNILDGLHCGVKVVASAHANSIEELCHRTQVRRLLEHGAFERIVMLGGADSPGEIKEILEVGELIGQAGGDVAHRSMLIDDGRFHGVRVIQTSFSD